MGPRQPPWRGRCRARLRLPPSPAASPPRGPPPGRPLSLCRRAGSGGRAALSTAPSPGQRAWEAGSEWACGRGLRAARCAGRGGGRVRGRPLGNSMRGSGRERRVCPMPRPPPPRPEVGRSQTSRGTTTSSRKAPWPEWQRAWVVRTAWPAAREPLPWLTGVGRHQRFKGWKFGGDAEVGGRRAGAAGPGTAGGMSRSAGRTTGPALGTAWGWQWRLTRVWLGQRAAAQKMSPRGGNNCKCQGEVKVSSLARDGS